MTTILQDEFAYLDNVPLPPRREIFPRDVPREYRHVLNVSLGYWPPLVERLAKIIITSCQGSGIDTYITQVDLIELVQRGNEMSFRTDRNVKRYLRTLIRPDNFQSRTTDRTRTVIMGLKIRD